MKNLFTRVMASNYLHGPNYPCNEQHIQLINKILLWIRQNIKFSAKTSSVLMDCKLFFSEAYNPWTCDIIWGNTQSIDLIELFIGINKCSLYNSCWCSENCALSWFFRLYPTTKCKCQTILAITKCGFPGPKKMRFSRSTEVTL